MVRWRAGSSRSRRAQQAEPFVEPGDDLGDRHDPAPGCRQLDGQRDAVAPLAEPLDRGRSAGAGDVSPIRSRNSAAASSISRSGASRYTTSPAMPSGSRLVASTATDGAPLEDVADELGTGVDDLLAVVQHEHRLHPAQTVEDRPSRDRPRSAGTPSASATFDPTIAGSLSADRSTIHTPSAHDGATRTPSSVASRVLPMPPMPTMVTARPGCRRRPISSSSPVRPTNVVAAGERLCRSAGTARTAGNRRSPPPTWYSATGPSKSRIR